MTSPFKRFAALYVLMACGFVQAADLPDPTVTPGATNPAVTQDTIKDTICKIGWTKTIRPPNGYTSKLKVQQMRDLGLTGSPREYEEDHLISLELGGHPTDPKNLWPEPWTSDNSARKKDALETYLKRQVCAGRVTLAEAQQAIATNWIAAYDKYMPARKKR